MIALLCNNVQCITRVGFKGGYCINEAVWIDDNLSKYASPRIYIHICEIFLFTVLRRGGFCINEAGWMDHNMSSTVIPTHLRAFTI